MQSGVEVEPVNDYCARYIPDATSPAKASELSKTIQIDRSIAALGRFVVTHDPKDVGEFRTPSLRNVAITAPYMHDGSVATLHEAVAHELYYSANDRGAGFSVEEREALAAFLRALSD